MLRRVACSIPKNKKFADVVLDFVPDVDTSWPDLVRRSPAKAASIRVRLRFAYG